MNSMYYRRSLRSFCSRSNINVQTSVLSRLANIFIRNNALKIGHLMCSISFHSIEKTLNKMACAIGTRNKLRIQFDFGKNTLIQFKLFTLYLFCFCSFYANAIVKCKFCMYLYNNLAISLTQNTYMQPHDIYQVCPSNLTVFKWLCVLLFFFFCKFHKETNVRINTFELFRIIFIYIIQFPYLLFTN